MSKRNRDNNRKFKSFEDDNTFFEGWDADHGNDRHRAKDSRREARRAAERRRDGWVDREAPWRR